MAESVEQKYPHLARYVKTQGYVEIGYTDDGYIFSFVRALDPGGMIWEGETSYATLDDALQALEAGIHKWLHEEMGEP